MMAGDDDEEEEERWSWLAEDDREEDEEGKNKMEGRENEAPPTTSTAWFLAYGEIVTDLNILGCAEIRRGDHRHTIFPLKTTKNLGIF